MFRYSAIIAFAAAAACSGQPDVDAANAAAAATTAPEAAVDRLAGTPDGGLREWVAEIRAGVAALPEATGADADAAKQRAVDLYVNRQEWLERYWGSYGVLTQNVAADLGEAVMEAEARFHELLTILAGNEATPQAVGEAVTALDAQLERVLVRAAEAGVPLVPPAAASPDEDAAR